MTTSRPMLVLSVLSAALVSAPAWAHEQREQQREQPSTPPAQTLAATPSAQQILEKYIAALGGEEAIGRHTSRLQRGVATRTGKDTEGLLTIYTAAPNKSLVVISSVYDGDQKWGFDGLRGWKSTRHGAELLRGDALAESARATDLSHPLRLADNYTLRVVGPETFDHKPAYRLGLTPKSAAQPADADPAASAEQFLIFDASTGLLIGKSGDRHLSTGLIKSETIFADYHQFGGVMSPTRIATTYDDQVTLTLTIRSVEYDNVPPEIFDPPADAR